MWKLIVFGLIFLGVAIEANAESAPKCLESAAYEALKVAVGSSGLTMEKAVLMGWQVEKVSPVLKGDNGEGEAREAYHVVIRTDADHIAVWLTLNSKCEADSYAVISSKTGLPNW